MSVNYKLSSKRTIRLDKMTADIDAIYEDVDTDNELALEVKQSCREAIAKLMLLQSKIESYNASN